MLRKMTRLVRKMALFLGLTVGHNRVWIEAVRR